WSRLSARTRHSFLHLTSPTQHPIVIRTLTFEGPLWDIAWRDTFLICASSQGKITMTILGTENALPPQELTCPSVNDEELDLVELAEGRVWVGDEATRVRRVALHPRLATTSTLLSAQCSAVQIWDIANSDAPLLAKRVSKDLVLCAEWDPHNDKIFGVAGQRGTMKLLDARDGSSEYSCVWVKRQAHAAPIRAMKWNPCVPHWIATGGEEGLVKLWDLRYGARPVCTIHGHTGPVNSVDWNAAHPDLLVSGGSDRSLRVTSLTADNLAVIGSMSCGTLTDQITQGQSFLRKQYSDKPPSDEEILGLLGTHVESFISLSAHVNRAYLNALFRQEAWDAFYILATELAHKAKGFEFETYVNNFMRDVVFPAFSNYLDSCLEPKAKLPAKRECIKKIASFDLNITLGADISYLTQLLPSVVKNVWKSIRKDIEKANRKEADKKKAVAFAKNMLADLEDIMAGKSFKTDAIEYEVKKVTDGLVDFISQ
ncbi:WD domain, Gbeta repeat domain containing protein, partial [Acanthamoeba castellanii str. Neff]